MASGGLKELVFIFAVVLLPPFLIKTFLFRASYIPSGSMENTLQIRDRVFVNLLVPEPMSLKRWDIVLLKDSQGWLEISVAQSGAIEGMFIAVGLALDSSTEHLNMGLIGFSCDRVIWYDSQGKISINAQPIAEPYLPSGAQKDTGQSYPRFNTVVPTGKIWVMGDNRNNSSDSRIHHDLPGKGFVPVENIVGKASVLAWPISNWSILNNYGDTFSMTDQK
ncbi:signal peptidase I [Arthrobacter sp. TWP1-1]|uniref:signal peptidase I n=1 Tax=Arthrobacter sp. TWP1-1 TaxID=2804568 RepID=UPI003CF00469